MGIILLIVVIILAIIFFSLIIQGLVGVGIFIAMLFKAPKIIREGREEQKQSKGSKSSFREELHAKLAANDTKYKAQRAAKAAARAARKDAKKK